MDLPMGLRLNDVPIHPHRTFDMIPTIYLQISNLGLRLLPRSTSLVLLIYTKWRHCFFSCIRHGDKAKGGHTHNPSGSNFDRRESVADSIPSVVGK